MPKWVRHSVTALRHAAQASPMLMHEVLDSPRWKELGARDDRAGPATLPYAPPTDGADGDPRDGGRLVAGISQLRLSHDLEETIQMDNEDGNVRQLIGELTALVTGFPAALERRAGQIEASG